MAAIVLDGATLTADAVEAARRAVAARCARTASMPPTWPSSSWQPCARCAPPATRRLARARARSTPAPPAFSRTTCATGPLAPDIELARRLI
jgi:hypothetical protein